MSERIKVSVLATDMDGTFIPMEGDSQNQTDLLELQGELDRNDIALMYVTGRHFDLVLDAIRSYGLPSPPWMICDVGASIYHINDLGTYTTLDAYTQQLIAIVGEHSRDALVRQINETVDLRLQEEEKQTEFKVSYYCDAEMLDDAVQRLTSALELARLPYRIISSVDPFTGVGLIDLLPAGVSKAYALRWWAGYTQSDHESIIFAGDSGNDVAALTAGYRSIVVGNAERSVVDQVQLSHREKAWSDRLVISSAHATSGVLEGLRYFLKY